MNITSIKERAQELVNPCKAQLIRIFVLMTFVGLIPGLFSGDDGLMSLLSLIATIAFIAFNHGYIVTTLKVVRNNAQALKDDDAFVGFSRFKELATTYLVMFIIYAVIAMVISLVFFILFIIVFAGSMSALSYAVETSGASAYDAAYALLAYAPTIIFVLLAFFIFIMVIMYIVNLNLFATPYLLEQYNMKNMDAVKESRKFMKGFKMDLFKLDVSYLGWFILELVIVSVVGAMLSFVPILGGVIGTCVGGVFAVYCFIPQYHVSRAIFFEEIAYQRYEQTNNEVVENKEGE